MAAWEKRHARLQIISNECYRCFVSKSVPASAGFRRPQTLVPAVAHYVDNLLVVSDSMAQTRVRQKSSVTTEHQEGKRRLIGQKERTLHDLLVQTRRSTYASSFLVAKFTAFSASRIQHNELRRHRRDPDAWTPGQNPFQTANIPLKRVCNSDFCSLYIDLGHRDTITLS